MRFALAGLLLLGLPLTGAQDAPVELATLAIEPFAALVQPLKEPVTTALVARVSCILAQPNGVPVSMRIVSTPEWASSIVSPATAVAPVDACSSDGWTEARSTLIVTATDAAPGFRAMPITVEAVAGTTERQARAEATVNLSASYFSILDVQVIDSILEVAPGSVGETSLTLTNLGNAETRVSLTLTQPAPTLQVTLPAPVELESRQAGGTRTSAQVPIRIHAPAEDGFVNRVETFTLQAKAAYAKDDAFGGDEATVSVLVTIRQALGQGPNGIPATGALTLLALAVGAAYLLPKR